MSFGDSLVDVEREAFCFVIDELDSVVGWFRSLVFKACLTRPYVEPTAMVSDELDRRRVRLDLRPSCHRTAIPATGRRNAALGQRSGVHPELAGTQK